MVLYRLEAHRAEGQTWRLCAYPKLVGRLVDVRIARTSREVASRVVVQQLAVGTEPLNWGQVGSLADLHGMPIDHAVQPGLIIDLYVSGEQDDVCKVIAFARCDRAPTLEQMRAAQMRGGPSSHRCPGCNAEHRGEYDHCEACRARIASASTRLLRAIEVADEPSRGRR